jgi:soluble lytic murein transglycosylase-like protein
MMRRIALVGSLVVLIALMSRGPAAAFARLTDTDGVTYYTNAPTDPRYSRIPGLSGTAAGWLRMVPAVMARYGREIREISSRHGVSADLVEAVIRVESGFNRLAVSRKGAQGLMQLMPRTAASLGVRDAFDPGQNIEGGVRHLRYLLDRYPGNLSLALAAYNAGEGAVALYGGVPPYPETRGYVRRVLAESGTTDAPIDRTRLIFKHEAPDGTVTFSNVPLWRAPGP